MQAAGAVWSFGSKMGNYNILTGWKAICAELGLSRSTILAWGYPVLRAGRGKLVMAERQRLHAHTLKLVRRLNPALRKLPRRKPGARPLPRRPRLAPGAGKKNPPALIPNATGGWRGDGSGQ